MEVLIKEILKLTLSSSVMIAAVLVLRKVFEDRLAKSVVSLLWLLVMVRLVVPVTFEAPVHLQFWIPERMTDAAVLEDGEAATAEIAETLVLDAAPETEAVFEPAGLSTDLAQAEHARLADIRIWQILFGVWAAGALAALAVSIQRMAMLSRKIKKRMLISGKTVAQMAYLGGNALGITKSVFVYECEYIDSPITCGIIRPKILLPAHLTQRIGETKTGLILFHELVHIKRQDVLKNYLWLIVKIFYWFNPLVYLASNAYLEDIEIACDEVVKKKHSRGEMLEYSQGLLDVIRLSQGDIQLPTVISFCKDTTKIRKRVENMLKPKRKSKWMMTVTLAVMMVLSLGCFTTACQPEKTDGSTAAEAPGATPNAAVDQPVEESARAGYASVGTEENALAIVKAHNLTGTDQFRYEGLVDNVLPFHVIVAEDGTDTFYQVYDFNGEILQASIEANVNENKATITEEEAEARVSLVVDLLYDDVEATIDRCVLSRGTFFEISGTLVKADGGSTREFGMTLNGDGEFCGIVAPYDALDVVGASNELRSKVLSYSLVDGVSLTLTDIDSGTGEDVYTIALNGADSPRLGDQVVRINPSDLSLLEFTSYLGRTDDPIAMEDYQVENAARSYIADYFPQFSNVVFIAVEKAYSEGSVLAEAVGCDGQIFVSIWADGSIKTIKLMDAADKAGDGGEASDETAQKAKEKLLEYYADLTRGKDLTLLRVYNQIDNENRTVYEFGYQSGEPSIRDYSFVAAVTHDTASDRFYAKISPVLDELELISEDEAIEKARQIVSKEQNIRPEKLKVDYFNLMEMSILYYEISLIYDNTGYTVRLYADTGDPEVGYELHLD